MGFLYALRYFFVVSVVPRFFIAGFVVAVAAAAARLTSDPSAATEALTPIVLLQMFVAPSGFQLPARRGYYDLLLTTGTTRWQVALAHCCASTAPGLVAWHCVSMLELAASHGRLAVCLAPGTCVAVTSVSIISWASGVFTTRAATGVGWLLLMSIPPITRLASPLQLIGGSSLASASPVSAIVIALMAAAVAVGQIVRGETRLEAAQ